MLQSPPWNQLYMDASRSFPRQVKVPGEDYTVLRVSTNVDTSGATWPPSSDLTMSLRRGGSQGPSLHGMDCSTHSEPCTCSSGVGESPRAPMM